MLKKLLYLYNDGHNPFPKLGKGGLGYKPPIYGDGFNLDTLQFDSDSDMDSTEAARRNEVLRSDTDTRRTIRRMKKPSEEVETPGFEFLEDSDNDRKGEKEVRKHHALSHLESVGVNTNEYLRKIDPVKVKRNEERFEENLYDNANFIIQDLETKVHDTKYTDQEKNTMLKTMKTIGINYREKLIEDAYDELYEKRRIDYPDESITTTKKALVGKAFEEFLCTSGKAITRKIFNTLEGNAINFDDNKLVPTGLKKYCVVDIETDKGIGEAKDYSSHDFSNVNGTLNIQQTKLTGNPSFKIYFSKRGTDDYIVKYITCNNKPINNPNYILDKYNVIVNTKKGIYYHNLLKNKNFVNDNTVIAMSNNLYQIGADNLPKTMDYVSGSLKPIPSIRINNTDFKKMENKKPKFVNKKTVKNIII